nr:MAG TPA: hypothetical protein [Caudoviricetes sp.]
MNTQVALYVIPSACFIVITKVTLSGDLFVSTIRSPARYFVAFSVV